MHDMIDIAAQTTLGHIEANAAVMMPIIKGNNPVPTNPPSCIGSWQQSNCSSNTA